MDPTATFLTPHQVVKRYGNWISVKTLANWRTKQSGPAYVKIGGRIFYKLCALTKWEREREVKFDQVTKNIENPVI
jgi:hypothetical protein